MRMKVTSQMIARLLVRALPVEGEELASKVEEYTRAIDAMPQNARLALKSAYIFSTKMPKEERENMFQELARKVLIAFNHSKVDIPEVNETFAYKVAHNNWLTWWRDTSRHRRIAPSDNFNEVTTDEDEDEVELIDTLVGEDDFERECQKRGIKLFVLPPGSPKLNGHAERAQRTHTKELYKVTEANF